MHQPEIFILDNGIKVVFQPLPGSYVAHCATLINAGTRDELRNKEGMAHFIEHVLFKGTHSRKFYHILNRMEVVGGELNAFTSKEETCIHSSFKKEHLDRATELIADILFNSVFPERELKKEKEVILDEIRTYLDSPSEQIYDDFETLLFGKHPMGNPILGTPQTVTQFSRKDIFDFIRKNYSNKKIVFAVAGDFDREQIKQLSKKYFSGKTFKPEDSQRKKIIHLKPQHKVVEKNTMQCHYIMGTEALSYHHPKRITMVLLNNILGGPGMNSRLNLGIREKYGFTYSVESNYLPYYDTGVFHVYLATEKKYLDKTISLVWKELDKLKHKKITSLNLKQAKQQLIGQITLAQENKSALMISLAKSLLNYGKIMSMEEVYSRIEKISSIELQEMANKVFDKNKMSSLVYQPAH